MTPPLPIPAYISCDGLAFTESQLLAYRADVIEMCAANLLEAGFRSTGIPAYESLAERLRKLK